MSAVSSLGQAGICIQRTTCWLALGARGGMDGARLASFDLSSGSVNFTYDHNQGSWSQMEMVV